VALLVNAIEAMPGGGTLSVRTKTAQGGILVQVSDTGVGIDPEVKARIFEPFFTTKQEEGSKSLGLGLAVVYGIIQRHQGTISVDSVPGKGTTFSLFLPAKSGENSP
jgi:signal transduction histidine kinase